MIEDDKLKDIVKVTIARGLQALVTLLEGVTEDLSEQEIDKQYKQAAIRAMSVRAVMTSFIWEIQTRFRLDQDALDSLDKYDHFLNREAHDRVNQILDRAEQKATERANTALSAGPSESVNDAVANPTDFDLPIEEAVELDQSHDWTGEHQKEPEKAFATNVIFGDFGGPKGDPN